MLFLRARRPDLDRPFRTPWVPFLPILSVVLCVVLMLSLPWATWERLLIWMAIGLGIYVAYGYRHSKLRT